MVTKLKRHLSKSEILFKAKTEATAYMATSRAVKLISLVILSEEFGFDPSELKLFLERFDDTLDYYNTSNDYKQLLTEWNEYFKETIERVVKTREWTKSELARLGFVFPDSMSNFVFAKHTKKPAAELFEKLREKGIFVRYFNVRVDVLCNLSKHIFLT